MDLDSPIPYTVADGDGPVPCGPAGARSSHAIDSSSLRVRRIYGPRAAVLAVRSTLTEVVDPTRPGRVDAGRVDAGRVEVPPVPVTRPRGER